MRIYSRAKKIKVAKSDLEAIIELAAPVVEGEGRDAHCGECGGRYTPTSPTYLDHAPTCPGAYRSRKIRDIILTAVASNKKSKVPPEAA